MILLPAILYIHAKSLQSCLTLCDPMNCSLPGSFVHGDSPGKNTGVGCHAFLQRIFLTQGSNRVSCGLGSASGFFTAESLGKPTKYPRGTLYYCDASVYECSF